MSKTETLQQAKKARLDEIEHYQINIDNYKSAIKLIEQDNEESMFAFKQQLEELLSSSLIEQKKASIMLKAIIENLGE